MRRLFAFAAALLFGAAALAAELPDSLYVGVRDGHVQGIALDRGKGYMYFSFTSSFIKTDLSGRIVGTINLGVGNLTHDQAVFYVAIIDVDRINRLGMDPETDGVMTTVCIREAVKDYAGSTYGCTGIDGITFAPLVGSGSKKPYLYVAYGIRGDNSRPDNDNQVILCYDIRNWKRRYETPVVFGTVPDNGPAKPLHKYFIHTGNTTWGVQNMAYDAATGRIYLAVYKGKKPRYPNYPLFSFDVAQKPVKACPPGLDEKQETLQLSADGLLDEASGVRGWDFKWGSTGLCPLGDGFWYISENHKDKASGIQSCTARLYRWTGEGAKPFVVSQYEKTDN